MPACRKCIRLYIKQSSHSPCGIIQFLSLKDSFTTVNHWNGHFWGIQCYICALFKSPPRIVQQGHSDSLTHHKIKIKGFISSVFEECESVFIFKMCSIVYASCLLLSNQTVSGTLEKSGGRAIPPQFFVSFQNEQSTWGTHQGLVDVSLLCYGTFLCTDWNAWCFLVPPPPRIYQIHMPGNLGEKKVGFFSTDRHWQFF